MKIGRGIFTWDGSERRSDRYGSFFLTSSNYNGDTGTNVFLEPCLETLIGKRVRITCTVLEARVSGHCGDLFHNIYPSQPEVGEVVDLGVGVLNTVMNQIPSESAIVLQPGDGRADFWINPNRLYRLHDQTVEVFAEETDADFTPAVDFMVEKGVIGTGDSSVQVKNESSPFRLVPDIERIGEGTFIVTSPEPRFGKRLKHQ